MKLNLISISMIIMLIITIITGFIINSIDSMIFGIIHGMGALLFSILTIIHIRKRA